MLREETDAHTHNVEIICYFLIRCLFWKNTGFALLFLQPRGRCRQIQTYCPYVASPLDSSRASLDKVEPKHGLHFNHSTASKA